MKKIILVDNYWKSIIRRYCDFLDIKHENISVSIVEWLKNEYNAEAKYKWVESGLYRGMPDKLIFNNEEDLILFKLTFEYFPIKF